MANLLLAASLVGLAVAWRRTSFWLPGPVALPLPWRTRLLSVAGWLVIVLVTGFSLGDVLGGRTQISRSPVRYATRLRAADAHVHDLPDAGSFWRQVALQSSVGLLVGIAFIRLSAAPSAVRPSRA